MAPRLYAQILRVQEIDGKYYLFKDFGRNNTNWLIKDWICFLQDNGVGEIILTSIIKDGTQSGFDTNLIEHIKDIIEVPFLINGGCGSLEDIYDVTKYEFISGVVLSTILHNSKKKILQRNKFK